MPNTGRLLMRRGFSHTCPCCGANRCTEYKHDDDCIKNLPEGMWDNWKLGFKTRLSGPTKKPTEDAPLDISAMAYTMGVRCAEKKLGA